MLAFSGSAVAALPEQATIDREIGGLALSAPGNDAVLKERLRQELVNQAHKRFPTTVRPIWPERLPPRPSERRPVSHLPSNC